MTPQRELLIKTVKKHLENLTKELIHHSIYVPGFADELTEKDGVKEVDKIISESIEQIVDKVFIEIKQKHFN